MSEEPRPTQQQSYPGRGAPTPQMPSSDHPIEQVDELLFALKQLYTGPSSEEIGMAGQPN